MSFISKMEDVLGEEYNVSRTENGALGYRTTQKEIVDFNFKVSSYRNASEETIIKDFTKVFYEDKILAMQFLFYIRDIKEGLGERRLFRILIKWLADFEPDILRKLLPLIADYGRWDDLFELFDTKLEKDVMDLLYKQLVKDGEGMFREEPISLLGKWLPSINASSKETKRMALKICNAWGRSVASYRKGLSAIREYLDVVETKMCANEWGEIDYSKVPSKANLKYNKAFFKHDEERRQKFLDRVSKGEEKINAGTLYPHDIVHKYLDCWGFCSNRVKDYDETLEQLWKALPKKDLDNVLVVIDGSGSMYSRISNNTQIYAIDVAVALGIYFGEHNTGEFKNNFITFSKNPQLVKLDGTLRDKIAETLAYNEVSNTDIEKVFSLILNTALKYKMKQEDLPSRILIVSDMEFDEGVECGFNEKLFNYIAGKYEIMGYKLPKLVFWNVASRTNTIPVKENKLGIALVSGFSTNIVDMVMSDKLDPYEILVDKLNTNRYKKIKESLS